MVVLRAMRITDYPAIIRAAGIKAVETSGWASRSHGEYPSRISCVWHHDASPPGDSPGVLDWMISNWSQASANVWVDNYGCWYFVGAGISYHAGNVLSGMPGNSNSFGIETDQTTGEAWPPAQLHSLRAGTAAIFRAKGLDSSWLHFHKTICSPPGRKVDPTGLDLGTERGNVGAMISGGSTPPPVGGPTPTPPTQDEDDETMKLIKADTGNGATFAYSPGRFIHVPSPSHLDIGTRLGLWDGNVKVVPLGELDVTRDNCVGNTTGKGDNLTTTLPSALATA